MGNKKEKWIENRAEWWEGEKEQSRARSTAVGERIQGDLSGGAELLAGAGSTVGSPNLKALD